MTTQEQQIETAVWLHYLETGKPATAKDIAAAAERSAGWVRKHWTDPGPTVEFCAVNIEKRSRDYGTQLGSQRVDALQPTRAYMRERIMGLMAAAQAVAS